MQDAKAQQAETRLVEPENFSCKVAYAMLLNVVVLYQVFSYNLYALS